MAKILILGLIDYSNAIFIRIYVEGEKYSPEVFVYCSFVDSLRNIIKARIICSAVI